MGFFYLQTVHYIYCYFRCRKSADSPVNVIVPTGAAGNIACKYLCAGGEIKKKALKLCTFSWVCR